MGLGALKSEHPYRGAGKWIGLIAGGLCLLAGPAFGLLALVVGYETYTTYGTSRVLSEVSVLLVFGAVLFGIGALVVFNAWRNWPLAAALYENGFAYYDRGGLKQLRWDQVPAVWQAITKHYTNGVYTGTTHVYTVQGEAGLKIKLDDRLAKVEDLGAEVQRGVSNALYPGYVQALQNGQKLTFGPLALDLRALYAGKKEIEWKDIQAVKIERGVISVKKEKGWFSWTSVSVPQVPNFFVFWSLISKLATVE